jgi:hypothetical protein
LGISEVTRRDIIDYLILREEPFFGRIGLISFLKRIWDLSSLPSTDQRFTNAEGDIWQHLVNNNDWDYEYLLVTYLNLLKCDEEIFLLFLQQILHPMVLNNETLLSESVNEINQFLIHDGYKFEVDSLISGRPIYKAKKNNMISTSFEEFSFEVVLSFAGEDREYVEKVAEFLRDHNVKIFYDKYEEVTLWGKDLVEHLDKVYRGSARYCVMFISEHYANKIWTNHERKSALARAIEEKEEYILPVRFDMTEVPGIRPTLGYIDISSLEPETLGGLILQKLGHKLSKPM